MNHINHPTTHFAPMATPIDPMSVLSKHGKSFHFAGKFLPKQHMRDCARLYSFCRYVDDIADLTPDKASAKKQLDHISIALQQGHSTDARVQDFIQLAAEKDIQHAVVDELLKGLKQDLGAVFFEQESQLKRYCYRVAGTVGLMMCQVLGVDDEQALPFAIDLGMAMQLTNIARDVYEDALMKRCYVPAEWMKITAADEILSANRAQQQIFKSAIIKLLSEAEHYYQSAERGLAYLPARARLAIAIAARVYRGIGQSIKNLDYAVWQQRAYVKKRQKIAIASSTTAQFLVQRKYHTPMYNHNPILHQHLYQLPACNAWLKSEC